MNMMNYLVILATLFFPMRGTSQTHHNDSSSKIMRYATKLSERVGEKAPLSNESKQELTLILLQCVRDMMAVKMDRADKTKALKLKNELKEKMLFHIKACFGNEGSEVLKQLLSPSPPYPLQIRSGNKNQKRRNRIFE